MKRKNISEKTTIFLMALFILVASASFAMAEVLVIVNPAVPIDEIDTNTLRDMYLGKKGSWNKDMRVVLTVLKKGAANDEFLKKYMDRTAAQFQGYWNKLLFTGTGTPPASFNTEQELVEYVAKTKGAIGYIDSATPHKNVKVLKVK